jgi:hypothetical protein
LRSMTHSSPSIVELRAKRGAKRRAVSKSAKDSATD